MLCKYLSFILYLLSFSRYPLSVIRYPLSFIQLFVSPPLHRPVIPQAGVSCLTTLQSRLKLCLPFGVSIRWLWGFQWFAILPHHFTIGMGAVFTLGTIGCLETLCFQWFTLGCFQWLVWGFQWLSLPLHHDRWPRCPKHGQGSATRLDVVVLQTIPPHHIFNLANLVIFWVGTRDQGTKLVLQTIPPHHVFNLAQETRLPSRC